MVNPQSNNNDEIMLDGDEEPRNTFSELYKPQEYETFVTSPNNTSLLNSKDDLSDIFESLGYYDMPLHDKTLQASFEPLPILDCKYSNIKEKENKILETKWCTFSHQNDGTVPATIFGHNFFSIDDMDPSWPMSPPREEEDMYCNEEGYGYVDPRFDPPIVDTNTAAFVTSGTTVPSLDKNGTNKTTATATLQKRKRSSSYGSKKQRNGHCHRSKNDVVMKEGGSTKIYTEPTDNDVLLGRGGRSNHHPGNIQYRDEAKRLEEPYRNAIIDTEKTRISNQLVGYVYNKNGRFLANDGTGWYEIPHNQARKKASQRLRDKDDKTYRDAKRQRHIESK